MDVNEYSYPTILVFRLDDTQPDLRPKGQEVAAGCGSIDHTRRLLGGMTKQSVGIPCRTAGICNEEGQTS